MATPEEVINLAKETGAIRDSRVNHCEKLRIIERIFGEKSNVPNSISRPTPLSSYRPSSTFALELKEYVTIHPDVKTPLVGSFGVGDGDFAFIQSVCAMAIDVPFRLIAFDRSQDQLDRTRALLPETTCVSHDLTDPQSRVWTTFSNEFD